MKIMHWMRKEHSGLSFQTIEIADYEQRAGHQVCIKQPGEDQPIFGVDRDIDLHCIHSQLGLKAFHDHKPKLMWMHGEPLSSVGNGISMKAIVDLAPSCDAFICMRREEHGIWSSIKRTHYVPKGVDLDVYKPIPGITEKLSGEPSVLYIENWRGQRNPLYLCKAMEIVHQKLPNARLHLYNCNDKKMQDCFKELIQHCHWVTFIRSLCNGVQGKEEVNLLYNRVDMVVSCLYPLYARGIESFGAGKAFIGPGYREPGYPYTCELEPESMAAAILKCWEEYGKVDFRQWALDHHDVKTTVAEAVKVYERYL